MMEPFVEDVVAAAYDDTLTPDDRAVLMSALNAVPREYYENARSVANLHGMGREKAEAKANRLRDALLPFAQVRWDLGRPLCPGCYMFTSSCTCECNVARAVIEADKEDDR